MAFRMSGMTRVKSGAFKARKGIPKDVMDDYQALYGGALGRIVSCAGRLSTVASEGAALRVGSRDR
jgi:hypothetical protein